MFKPACVIISLLCFVAMRAIAEEMQDDRYEDSVVRLTVSKQVFDATVPWQAADVSQQLHLGVVLDNERILTTAFAVSDSSFIEMTQFGETTRWEMQLLFVDWECNLALLRAVKPAAFAGLNPVRLGDDLRIDDKVDIFRARDAYQMTRMAASLQEVGIYNAVTSNYTLVSYLLKVQQTGLGWSEPIFKDGRFVAMATGQDSNHVFAMPMAIIRHFLSDTHESGKYRGFPAIGVELDSLISPEVRRMIGAEHWQRGVRIAEVQVDSPFATLIQPDDVLLEVAGTPVSEHGFVTHPKWGKVYLKYLLNQFYAGDAIALKIVRQGKELIVTANLTRFDSNRPPIAYYRYGQREPYLIFGGMVFQELTRSFLKEWGREWRSTAPIDLLYMYQYQNAPDLSPSRRPILMNRILADDFNRGYSGMSNLVVDKVNERKVESLTDLKMALQRGALIRNGRRYAKVSFLRGGGEIVLSYDGLRAAHERMAKTYEIAPNDAFFIDETH